MFGAIYSYLNGFDDSYFAWSLAVVCGGFIITVLLCCICALWEFYKANKNEYINSSKQQEK